MKTLKLLLLAVLIVAIASPANACGDCEPCIEVMKMVDCEVSKAGDTVIYTYWVHNCGNVEVLIEDAIDSVVPYVMDAFLSQCDPILLPDDGLPGGLDECWFIVEYVMKPRMVGQQAEMHTLLTFLSIIGGLSTFGILGLLYGPLIMTAFLSLAELYKKTYEKALLGENNTEPPDPTGG